MIKKILIPFHEYSRGAIGGGVTFMAHLKAYLDGAGVRYARRSFLGAGIESVFFPISYNLTLLKLYSKMGIRIIQRLDGVYYPSKHGGRSVALNRKMMIIHNSLADVVIYQSQYSKSQCEAMFGRPSRAQTHVIINGTDPKVFFPKPGPIEVLDEIRFVTSGNFRNADMIEPVVRALDLLRPKLIFKLTTLGPVSNAGIRHFFERDYIRAKGSMNSAEVGHELRKSDIFIYSHLNPPCPNSVIEAVACGLPVVGFNSGGMEELLHFNTDLLADVSGDLFQKYEDFRAEKLAEKIMTAVKDYPRHRQLALDHADLYPFERTGRRYLNIFRIHPEGRKRP